MLTSKAEQQWHTLDFYYDSESTCALTIFIGGARFHILADGSKLDKGTAAGREYHDLQRDMGNSLPDDTNSHHGDEKDTDSDSGIDVKASMEKKEDEKESAPSEIYDAEATLKKWMVTPLVDSFEDLVPANDSSLQTLQDWYHSPTQFCQLVVAEGGDEIQAVALAETRDLRKDIDKLIPQTLLPRYISDKLNAPIYNASDFIVLEESDQPIGTPYHPCKVQHRKSKKTYFLKIVENNDPQPIKREIDILRRINDLGLREQIHVPSLEGLVTFDNARKTPSGRQRFMGFLQSVIPNPTPLTFMLRKEVSQKKRDSWANEVTRVKDLLHKHKIIWGDAKADNFVVDAEEKLWIIDFGGGYTDGWIDPKFNETEKGDNMGTEKIVNALKDPVANVRAIDDSAMDQKQPVAPGRKAEKRKRDRADSDTKEEEPRATKSRKSR